MNIKEKVLLTLCVLLGATGNQASVPRPQHQNPLGPRTGFEEESARSAWSFFNSVGLNVHLNYFDRNYGNFEMVERELRTLGVLHLRDGVHLQTPEYNQAMYSRWIAVGKIGIRFDAVLDPRSNLGPLSPAKLDQIESLAGGTIESFEGPNELDISGLKDWPVAARNYQREIYENVHAMPGDHKLVVIGPSLAAASNGSQAGDLSAYLDYGNLHPYPAGKEPSAVLDEQLRLAREVSGDKPVIITESGYHNASQDHHDQPAVSETAAAKYILRLYLENFSKGVSRTYLYEFLDESAEPKLKDLQMHWGLLRSDGTEKPSFQALRNLIAIVKDTKAPARLEPLRYRLIAPSSNVHHLVLEKADGTMLFILWNAVDSYNLEQQTDIANPSVAATIYLPAKAHKVTLYEPVMHKEPTHTYADVSEMKIQINDHPLIVQIDRQ